MSLATVECPTCKRPLPIERKDVYRTVGDGKMQYDARCACGQQIFGWLEPDASDLDTKILAMVQGKKHGETVEHMHEVLGLPTSEIHAALKRLSAQGRVEAQELFGRGRTT